VEVAEDLREVDLGLWESLTSEAAREGWPDIWRARGLDPVGVAPPGGESLKDLADRVWPAWRAIVRYSCGPIMVVAHRAVIRVILALELHGDLRMAPDIDFPYGGVVLVGTAAGASGA
jgi:broad specificity phosphatase PhoE